MDDENFGDMMKGFMKKINEDIDAKIKAISIDMSWCDNITDKALEHLVIDFPKKDKTEILSLNFSKYEFEVYFGVNKRIVVRILQIKALILSLVKIFPISKIFES